MSARVRSILESGCHELEREWSYRAGVGFALERRWRGTESECASALNALVAYGGVSDARISHDTGGYYILHVSYAAASASDTTAPIGSAPTAPTAESVVTRWTRESTRTEKELWTHPNVVTLLKGISPSTEDDLVTTVQLSHEMGEALVRRDLERLFRNDITEEQLQERLTQFNLSSNPTVKKLLARFARGVEAYQEDAFTIRMTQTGPIEHLTNLDTTINRIWSRATLIAQPTMPEQFKSRVPSGYFLQTAPRIDQQDDFRWQIVTDWIHGTEIDTWIYNDII